MSKGLLSLVQLITKTSQKEKSRYIWQNSRLNLPFRSRAPNLKYLSVFCTFVTNAQGKEPDKIPVITLNLSNQVLSLFVSLQLSLRSYSRKATTLPSGHTKMRVTAATLPPPFCAHQLWYLPPFRKIVRQQWTWTTSMQGDFVFLNVD